MAMFSTRSNANISWKLNLIRKRIEITFSLQISKAHLSRDSTPEPSQSTPGQAEDTFDRTELFMVEIPFSQLRELFLPDDQDPHKTERTFVLPLQDPPKYYRQLSDWSKTMEDRSLTCWNIYDVWMRQTDIEYNMKARQLHPIGLGNRHPVIDLGAILFFPFSYVFFPPFSFRFYWNIYRD